MQKSKSLPRRIHGLWNVAQTVSVLSAVAVVVLLLLAPAWGLYLTWFVLIPLVPALLLVAPRVWRNLCPIAVVHQLPRRLGKGGARRLSSRVQTWAPAVAAAGLFLIVPLRLPVFNEIGPALAVFVLLVLVAALVGGLAFAGKSGWCATFCPVGPVERLYGQQPIVNPEHAHCAACIGCTELCFDRDGAAAVVRLVGEDPGAVRPEGAQRAWLWRTPSGAFAAAFPGFILGYFTADPAGGLASVYAHVLLAAAVSFTVLMAAQGVVGFTSRIGIRVAAAAAAGLYYWFTVPSVLAAAESFWGIAAIPAWVDPMGRAAFLALVLLWLLDAPRRARAIALPVVSSEPALRA